MQSIVPFFIVMIPWLGFFSPKGMLPYQSTQTYFHSALSSKTFVFVFCPSESWTEDGSADIADCLYRGLTLLHFFFFRSFSCFFVLFLPISFVRWAMANDFHSPRSFSHLTSQHGLSQNLHFPILLLSKSLIPAVLTDNLAGR